MNVSVIELHPQNSPEECVLSFRDPARRNSYNIVGATGLDADEIVRKFYGNSASSIAAFYALSMEEREIVLKIALNPNFSEGKSYGDLRDDLYRMIASSRTGLIDIWFRNGEFTNPDTEIVNTVATISGFIEKFESPQFDKKQEVQLTIQCNDALLKSPNLVEIDTEGFDPTLITVDDEISTAPHGFDFEMTFSGFLATLSIFNPFDPSWFFEVSPIGGFGAGDILHFSSNPKDKKLFIERGPTEIPLADVVTPGSIWPILFPRENSLACDNPTVMEWTSISYYPLYWGV